MYDICISVMCPHSLSHWYDYKVGSCSSVSLLSRIPTTLLHTHQLAHCCLMILPILTLATKACVYSTLFTCIVKNESVTVGYRNLCISFQTKGYCTVSDNITSKFFKIGNVICQFKQKRIEYLQCLII